MFLEKYAEILTLVAVSFAIYFAASGKLEEFSGLGLKLKFRQLTKQEIFPKREEILGGRIDPTENIMAAQKGSYHFLQDIIIPNMIHRRYTTLSISQGVYIDLSTLQSYLNELSAFEFFKHVIFIDKSGKFAGHIFAETLLRIIQAPGGHETMYGVSVVDSINEWRLEEIPIVKHLVETGFTYGYALKRMRELGLDYMPMVDHAMQFAGVISKKEMMSMIFDKILLPS